PRRTGTLGGRCRPWRRCPCTPCREPPRPAAATRWCRQSHHRSSATLRFPRQRRGGAAAAACSCGCRTRRPAGLRACRRTRPPRAAAEERAGVVILLAPLLVGQHVVRLGDLLEALLGFRVALVGIRVVLAGQLAIRLLDLIGARVLGDGEALVVVLLEEVLGAQRASSRRV